jgi:hypothetical protein
MPRAQIKDERTYQKLRDQGESKEKSARIANAAAGSSRSKVGRKGGKSGSYDDWSKQDLLQRAKEIGIRGRSTMTKAELIKALRDHLAGRRALAGHTRGSARIPGRSRYEVPSRRANGPLSSSAASPARRAQPSTASMLMRHGPSVTSLPPRMGAARRCR